MKYKGVIWTNHILQRMEERELSYDDVYWVFRKPDKSQYAKTKNAWKFYRNYKNLRVALIATKNEKKEWVFMTCWTKVLPKEVYTQTKKGSFWKTILKQMFG
ncbi:DUF4258 domain-containing protein [Candidatus Beckwithbacteria bacterium]|nr:DUF4258 domain-containing protein [Candidatus Beckwithbacteria bacterium]